MQHSRHRVQRNPEHDEELKNLDHPRYFLAVLFGGGAEFEIHGCTGSTGAQGRFPSGFQSPRGCAPLTRQSESVGEDRMDAGSCWMEAD